MFFVIRTKSTRLGYASPAANVTKLNKRYSRKAARITAAYIVMILFSGTRAAVAEDNTGHKACAQNWPTPPVKQVVQAAISHARLPNGPAPTGRSRWAALLPKVTVRFQRTQGQASYFTLSYDEPNDLDTNARLSTRFEVSASWNLDRLIFDSHETALSQAAERSTTTRRSLGKQVVDLYYQRLRTIDTLCSDIIDPDERRAAQRKAEQLSAYLEFLSGGRIAFGKRTGPK